MNNQALSLKISRFWNWFLESEHLFKDVTDPQIAVEAMDNQILGFGLFSWEIGEGGTKPYYLLISPNGDRERMALSQKLIKAAPNLRDWEFHYCKPPKDWDYLLEVHDRFLVSQQIDASEWEYILFKTPDHFVEVTIQVLNMDDVDTEDQLNTAEVVLTKILGEELVVNYLFALEVVKEFSSESDTRSQHMPTLRRSFEKLISPE